MKEEKMSKNDIEESNPLPYEDNNQKHEEGELSLSSSPPHTSYLQEDDISIDYKSPEIQLKFKESLKIAIIGEIFIIVLVLICINVLYFSTYHTNYITRNHMDIAIYIPKESSSNGIIEKSILYVVNNKMKFNLNYSFIIHEYESTIDDNLNNIREKVNDGKYWGAFYVIDGASDSLMTQLVTSGPPMLTSGYFYDQVRAGPSFQYSLGSTGTTLTSYANSVLKSELFPTLYSSSNTSTITYVNSAIATKPINTLTTNLHAVTRYGMFSVIGDGTMQLFLNGMYHGLGLISVHSLLRGHGIDKGELLGLMGWHRVFGSAFLAIWPVAVPLILNPDDTTISDNPKLIFQWWAFTWLELAVFSGMNYHIAKLFGGPIGLLIGLSTLMLMVSSSTASLPYDAMSGFYQVGRGFPFYSAIQGMRSLLYASQKELLSLCIGILLIWWGVMLINLNFIRYYINPNFGYHLFEEPDEVAAKQREKERAQILSKHQQIQSENDGIAGEVNEHGIVLANLDTAPSQLLTRDDHDEEDPSHSTELIRNRVLSTEKDGRIIEESVLEAFTLPPSEYIPLSHPSLKPLMREFYMKSIIFEIILGAMLAILLFLTYGNAWNPFQFHKRIKLAMLNLDKSPSSLSTIFDETFQGVYSQIATSSQFGFTVDLLDDSDLSLHHAVQNVDYNSWKTDGTYWGILILHNGSANDLQHRLNASTSIPPAFPYFTFVYSGANGGSYVNANIRIWSSTVYGAISFAISKEILSQDYHVLQSYPSHTLSSLTSFAYQNLHPYPTEAPAVDSTINLAILILYLGMIMNIGIIGASHAPFKELGIKYETRIIIMVLHIALSSLILSFWPVVSLLWYGYEISGNIFFQYWAALWLGMCSFGSISISISYFFGPLFGGVISIILFSLNSAASGAVLNSLVQPTFFWIGIFLPYHNIITVSRYILFGCNYQAFQRGVGILIGWVGIVCIGALTMAERRRRYLRAKHKFEKVGRRLSTRIESYRLEHFSPAFQESTNQAGQGAPEDILDPEYTERNVE